MEIRLQKLLASAGLGSRRAIEDWIRAGRVTVGGRVAELGCRALPTDDIRLDGRKLDIRIEPTARQVLLYHKPLGEVTTAHDPHQRPTVFERLPPRQSGRWINVGRLDVNTQGLLLFTSDGDLAHRLMHPSTEIEREYLVRVRGTPPSAVEAKLLAGVRLEDGPARFDQLIRQPGGGSHTAFRVVLHEGRNREVRRLWRAVGFEVSRLLRIRYGPVTLPRDLKPGTWQLADSAMIAALDAAVRQAGPGPDSPILEGMPDS